MQSPKMRILCIEDNKATRELVDFVFGKAGYQVKTAATLGDGLRLIQSEPSDLYLVDYKFEDGMGVELITKIRTFDQHTPIIFYSADVRECVREEALSKGAQAFITKPSDPEALMLTVKILIAETKQGI